MIKNTIFISLVLCTIGVQAQAGFMEINTVGDKRAHFQAPAKSTVQNKITENLSAQAKYHAPEPQKISTKVK